MMGSVVAAAVASLVTSLVVTSVVTRMAPHLGLIDNPNPRSSHVRPTPRGGGVGLIAGASVGIAILWISGRPPASLFVLLLGSVAIAAIGALDDVRTVSARVRLVFQVIVALAISIAAGGIPRLPLPAPLDIATGPLAIPLGALWLAAVANFYNFMDGIDGLAAAQAFASCVGIAIAAWTIDVRSFAIVFAAAAIGFLVFNWPPARVFLGDVGSTSIGFTLAGLALVAGPGQRSAAVLAVAVGLTLFLLDPIETLMRLSRRGHRLGTPHRQHSYQILYRSYQSHAAVTAAVVGVGLILSLGGALAYRAPVLWWPVLVIAISAFALQRYLAGRKSSSQEALPAT